MMMSMPVPFDMHGKSVDKAFISPDADYARMIQQAIDGAELSKRYDQPWQQAGTEKQIEDLRAFLNNLQNT